MILLASFMKGCIIIGTRPQIIKSQPIIKEFKSQKIKLTVIHTGQHFDYKMSKAFFNELKIKDPDINLGISKGSPANQLSQIIQKLEKPLQKINPDIVLIPGDTRSALAGALTANRLNIPIAHIESGARSNDMRMEEEINRRLIDHMSKYLFAPTLNCAKNLRNESVLGKIYVFGDTMFDIFLEYKKILNLDINGDRDYILITIHRRENILNKQKLKIIFKNIKQISKNDYKIIFPIHPHTLKQIKSYNISLKGIKIIEPLKYSEMLNTLSKAKLLITDSGGLQKESFWVNTPCVTIRESTEWIETLKDNRNTLLKNIKISDYKKILNLLKLKSSKNTTQKIFGDGKAANKITLLLMKQF